MTNQPELYADVALPITQPPYTYRVGRELVGRLKPGMCVVAQVESKFYTGIVWRLHTEKPPFKTIRTIEHLVNNAPVLTPTQMKFWEWLAEYYMCYLGDIMRVGLPSSLKPDGFSQAEFEKDTYRLPTELYLSLHPSVDSEERVAEAFDSLGRAPRQYETLLELVSKLDEEALFGGELRRQQHSASMTLLRALQEKEIVQIEEREYQHGELPPLPKQLPELTEHQQMCYDSICEQFEEQDVVLLQGVTGSGKTEIYIKLIDEQLRAGKNVLYLLPEIAMTSQLIERIKGYFGERVITYHSRYSEGKRVESYLRANAGEGGEIVLGVRSSLFLPAHNLGLVVVDEEHDASYKSDRYPYYYARDGAVMLGRFMGAKTILGSATPSLESYANAKGGKYGYVIMEERYGGVPLPQISISDTMRAVQRGERKTHFNKYLIEQIEQSLEQGEQVMLFQNRRGFSPYVECDECGWVPFCPNCNVALTLHKQRSILRCHYCQHQEEPPHNCPQCNSTSISSRGFGTEKVEEELQELLPEARIDRLDSDTSQTARRYGTIITNFEEGETDILVGTQMITKGFDFAGVSLVGVLNADNLLAFPDFRASERAFQLMVQVAGRAGRREKQGRVVIQTAQPNNSLIKQVASYDFIGMAEEQLEQREQFFYPPYSRMIEIGLAHHDQRLLWSAGTWLDRALRPIFGRRLQGPQPPPIDRIRREYLLSFVLKVERQGSFAEAKRLLQGAIEGLNAVREYRYVRVISNVDPQ